MTGLPIPYFSNSFYELSFFDQYIELFDGYVLSSGIIHFPSDYEIGQTYIREDYNYGWGSRIYSAAACLELGYNEFWVVAPGLNDANGSSITVTIEGKYSTMVESLR